MSKTDAAALKMDSSNPGKMSNTLLHLSKHRESSSRYMNYEENKELTVKREDLMI